MASLQCQAYQPRWTRPQTLCETADASQRHGSARFSHPPQLHTSRSALLQLRIESNNKRRRHGIFASDAAAEGGGDDAGGTGGSGGGGGDQQGDGSSDGGSGGRLAGSVWLLCAAIATVMGLLGMYLKRKANMEAEAAAASAEPAHDDVAALKRLLREVFSELVSVKARLEELETETGLNSSSLASSAAADASYLGSGIARGSGSPAGTGSSSRHGKQQTAVSGVWRLSGGLLWAQDDPATPEAFSISSTPGPAAPASPGGGVASAGSAETLQATGVRLGTDLLLRVSRAVRGGSDSLHAECSLDPEGQRISIRRAVYRAGVLEGLRLLLAPFGAKGEDAAYTLNPLAGQGLAGLVRRGCPLHSTQLGSLLGAVVDRERAWGTAALFARGMPGGGIASSVMAQGIVAPKSTLSLGLTYLQHNSPGSAAAADSGSDYGSPLEGLSRRPSFVGALAGAGASSPGAVASAGRAGNGLLSRGLTAPEPSKQLGALLAYKLDPEVVLHGWATADAGSVGRSLLYGSLMGAAQPREWGLSIGAMPDGSGNGWAVGTGRLAGLAGRAADGKAVAGLLPNVLELSLQYNLGEGLMVTPGLLLLRKAGGKSAAFLGVKSEWHFF